MSYSKKIVFSLVVSVVSVVSVVLAGCGTVETKSEKKEVIDVTEKNSAVVAGGGIEAIPDKVESAVNAPKLSEVESTVSKIETPNIKEKNRIDTSVEDRDVTLDGGNPNGHVISLKVKSKKHPFFGVGDKRGFIIDGVEGKELVLKRGEVYSFKVDSTPMHDVYISADEMGWGAKVIENGVEGNFTFDGVVTIRPDEKTPDILYYQCQNHKAMGARLFVVDQNDSRNLADLTSKYGELGSANGKGGRNLKVTDADVNQKLSYASLVAMSKPAKRVKNSSNVEAKALFESSQVKLSEARKLQESGDNSGAMALIDEALRRMSAASQLVPSDGFKNEQIQRYNSEVKLLAQQEKSYKDAYNRLLAKGEDVVDYSDEDVSSYKASAKSHVNNKDYAAAISDIQQADRIVTIALNQMLDSQTVKYELNLDTPEGEYEYEHNRYLGYAELVPVAIDEKKPSAGQMMLLKNFVKKADEMNIKGENMAENGNYPDAIRLMQEATKQVRKALRMLGVKQ